MRRCYLFYFLVLFSLNSYCQKLNGEFLKKGSLELYVKSHVLYDSGNYRISDASDAKIRGIGLGYQYPINHYFEVFGNYNVGLTRDLPVLDPPSTRDWYHQLNFNVAVNLFQEADKYRSYLYIGYGWDKLVVQDQAVPTFGFKPHSNIGAGLNYFIGKDLALFYQIDFALQHQTVYLHNFQSQVGVAFKSLRLTPCNNN